MKKNNLIRFVQSLIFLPVMTVPISFGNIHNDEILQNILVQKQNTEAIIFLAANQPEDVNVLQEIREFRALAIDKYFEDRDMPLAGTGMKMVLEAEKNDIDWRLLPAIAVRESTGGKHACKRATYNSFGWGSCKINFKSNDSAIETVARNLGGNNPNTDHHYAGKTTKEILQKYNPPSIVKHYAEQVMSIMDDIGEADVIETPSVST
ncbi:hypothetical protein A3A95_03250 [Candidatus Nomurabacteria bacterium RIFCSPLOWO2_01_FULL_39_18]|uniref:Mannosyl-glycoprotein endo-beta-N-acetylglucosamidase-like domain-containing protein n=1 Tax=Candidatus Nomurabacteria bacterium RIFCSPHIGHO2_01_FULL_40_24b TaxID=1801739 RepID=A0A1F6V8W7_9BACT|nr:MAG: hypothetical protein A2647_00055 [Candidatus Nomurabacteria bacterium RIFCSPHIGHO2_01_FULL_40_24b]OGI90896.1 MAG: hypothetical protein A3A95_03250 [Candidatus Nomurabacteria bacterium RIFCSPLOWO2_01_FULL_39_18]